MHLLTDFQIFGLFLFLPNYFQILRVCVWQTISSSPRPRVTPFNRIISPSAGVLWPGGGGDLYIPWHLSTHRAQRSRHQPMEGELHSLVSAQNNKTAIHKQKYWWWKISYSGGRKIYLSCDGQEYFRTIADFLGYHWDIISLLSSILYQSGIRL